MATYYDPTGYKTIVPEPSPPAPVGTLNDPDTDVTNIPYAADPAGSVYADNQVLFSKTLLINRIFNLLVKMIGVLQKAAAYEANRLNFLTEWQKAYTDDMNQIHSFTVGNGDTFSFVEANNSQDAANSSEDMRTNLNQLNSNFTTQLQNLRGVVSDDAKSLQTNVNQLTDAVQQQSSLASSFLQQMGQLLTTIFRSS
jgi:hypothetical protein